VESASCGHRDHKRTDSRHDGSRSTRRGQR
jgi:hypothetical protein